MLLPAGIIQLNDNKRRLGVKVRRWVIECQMSVFTDSNEGHIDIIPGDDIADPPALGGRIVGLALNVVNLSRMNHINQPFFEITPKTCRMIGPKADVFIQMVHCRE